MNKQNEVKISNRIKDGQAKTAWLFCSPGLALIFTFIAIPFIMAIVYSFTNKMLIPKAGRVTLFVGVQNYIKLFDSSSAMSAFGNTFFYALLVVPAIITLSTLLAILVNNQLKGVRIFRIIYFSPQVVTMTAVAVVWSFLLSPTSDGLLNSFLKIFGLAPQRWLQDPKLAMLCIALMFIWQVVGLQMIIVLGGLQYIPEELYEAAYMDGCSTFQKFIYITMPSLKHTLTYVLISNTIGSLKLFTQVYVLTNGGPRGSTTSVVYWLYQSGFVNQQVGYSSAIAVVFFVLVFIISQVQNKAFERD